MSIKQPVSSKNRILKECNNAPTSWSKLLTVTGISRPALLQNINTLTKSGLIQKNRDGLYELTNSGKTALELIIEQERLIRKHEALSSVQPITQKQLTKVETLALKEDVTRLGISLIGVTSWIEVIHHDGIANKSNWVRRIPFDLLLSDSAGLGLFFSKFCELMGFGNLEEAGALADVGNAFFEEERDLKLVSDISAEHVIAIIQESADNSIRTCETARAHFKDLQDLARAFDVILTELHELKDHAKIDYDKSYVIGHTPSTNKTNDSKKTVPTTLVNHPKA